MSARGHRLKYPFANKLHAVFLLASALALIPAASRAAEGETALSVGFGKARFNSLLQMWALNDTTSSASKFNFRARRAELRFSGTLDETTRWFLMADAAKSLKTGAISAANDNKILQDLGIAFAVAPDLEFIAGQIKVPTTAESFDSAAELLLPERSVEARAYGERREPGVMSTWKHGNVKLSAMVSNGQAANVDDTNNNKDVNARAEFAPDDQLKISAFTTLGDFKYSAKGRWGAGAKFTTGPWLARAEGTHANDSGVKSNAWVADGGYAWNEHFQSAMRIEGVETPSLHARSGTLGLNYFLAGHRSKIQAAYTALHDLSGTSGSPAVAGGAGGSLVTVNFQAAI